MAELALEHVGKVYRNGYEAIHDFSLEIKEGEFLILVGPSGCGKSTLLRMIAGLEDISSGELWVDGEIKNYKEPRERNLAMVFQNYALYPNMSVYDNIAFSMSVRKVDKKEIKKKVYDTAKMRVELAALQHAVGTTTIYVTHDQTETMTLGTRIVVMRDGKMQQVDTPANLYAKPVNRFVAGFIGTPSMNFFEAQVVSWEEAPALLVGEYRMMPCREDAARISRHGSDSVIDRCAGGVRACKAARREDLCRGSRLRMFLRCLPYYISGGGRCGRGACDGKCHEGCGGKTG